MSDSLSRYEFPEWFREGFVGLPGDFAEEVPNHIESWEELHAWLVGEPTQEKRMFFNERNRFDFGPIDRSIEALSEWKDIVEKGQRRDHAIMLLLRLRMQR